MNKIEALLRVVIDGQAVLYALFYKLEAELLGAEVTKVQFLGWQNEWKEQTAELVKALTEGQAATSETDIARELTSADSSADNEGD